MTQQTFDIEGLRCGGCVNTVRETLLALDGIDDVEITLATTTPSVLRIEADHAVDTDLIQRSLAERGDFRIRR